MEIGFIAADTTTGSPLVMPPSRPPRRLLAREIPSIVEDDFVLYLAGTPGGDLEPHAEFDAFHGVDGHDGVRQLRVQFIAPVHVRTEPRRTALRHNDELAAEGVPGIAGGVYLGLHLFGDLRVRAADLGVVGFADVQGGAFFLVGGAPNAVDGAVDLHAEVREELFATPPAATRAVVSRALERSRMLRRSSVAYFCIPARSAWPGLGSVIGAGRSSTGSGVIRPSQFA